MGCSGKSATCVAVLTQSQIKPRFPFLSQADTEVSGLLSSVAREALSLCPLWMKPQESVIRAVDQTRS